MTNRRDFVKLGAVASALGLAGSSASARVTGFPFKVNGTDAKLQNAGVADALIKGGKDFSPITYQERKAVPSACLQCVSRCPIVGYVEDGKLQKISPQFDSIRTEGTLCAKAQAGVNQVYDPAAILNGPVDLDFLLARESDF